MAVKYIWLACFLLVAELCCSLAAKEQSCTGAWCSTIAEDEEGLELLQIGGSKVEGHSVQASEKKAEHPEPQGLLEMFKGPIDHIQGHLGHLVNHVKKALNLPHAEEEPKPDEESQKTDTEKKEDAKPAEKKAKKEDVKPAEEDAKKEDAKPAEEDARPAEEAPKEEETTKEAEKAEEATQENEGKADTEENSKEADSEDSKAETEESSEEEESKEETETTDVKSAEKEVETEEAKDFFEYHANTEDSKAETEEGSKEEGSEKETETEDVKAVEKDVETDKAKDVAEEADAEVEAETEEGSKEEGSQDETETEDVKAAETEVETNIAKDLAEEADVEEIEARLRKIEAEDEEGSKEEGSKEETETVAEKEVETDKAEDVAEEETETEDVKADDKEAETDKAGQEDAKAAEESEKDEPEPAKKEKAKPADPNEEDVAPDAEDYTPDSDSAYSGHPKAKNAAEALARLEIAPRKSTHRFSYREQTLQEVEQAQCVGCVFRPNECYQACGDKPGYCSACDSLQGTRGACCGQENGTRNGDDPEECHSVNIQNFPFSGYHQCVLTTNKAIYRDSDVDEESAAKMMIFSPVVDFSRAPKDEKAQCKDCQDRPNECWNHCGGPGYCDACNSIEGTRGACCGYDNGTRNADDPKECLTVAESQFKISGYHQCVLTRSKHQIEVEKMLKEPRKGVLTFITVYDPFFETNLGKSDLWKNREKLPHQWILINNSKKIPISKLYARAQAKAENDLQVYVHPDVFLPKEFYDEFMYKLQLIEDDDENWGVLGTAGIAGGAYGPLVSSITDATTGTWHSGIDSKEVTALDEQMLILRRGSPKWDANLPGFDMYGIDIVLSAKSLGMKSYLMNVADSHKLKDMDGSDFKGKEFFDKIYSDDYKARVNVTAKYFEQKWCHSGYLPITGTTFFVDCEGWKWSR